MKNLFQIHPIQIAIIDYLTYHPHARYTELNTTKITSDHFNFHLLRLVDNKLVEKNSDNTYSLTSNGKKMINTLSTGSVEILYNHYKIVVLIICKVKIGKITKFLLQKRQKEPFWGKYDVLAGKVHWDETTAAAAQRIVKEKIHLSLKPTFSHIRHKIDKDEKGNILENIFLYVYSTTITTHEVDTIRGTELLWVTASEIKKMNSIFDDIPSILQKQNSPYQETIQKVYDY